MKEKANDRIVAEETTTLPEGTVLSVYRIRVGKVGHQSTRLVALHNNMKRVEMTVDNISPHNLRVYLLLTQREIERGRAKLTAKPAGFYGHPKTIYEFVNDMAFNDMFIFAALSELHEGLDADKPKPIKKMVQRRRKVQKQSQVLPGNNGAMQ